jgi:hypothetical protein
MMTSCPYLAVVDAEEGDPEAEAVGAAAGGEAAADVAAVEDAMTPKTAPLT